LIEPVINALRDVGVGYDVFDGVHPDPPTDDVIAGTAIARKGRFDSIVGVGGGSAMDTAKAISALAPPGRRLEDLYGQDRVPGPGLTKILIPTTAGSGSEISDSCNFADRSGGDLKRILLSRHLLADLAVVDPLLTDDLPPVITAESGFDAVTHALEAFSTWKANAFADLWAREALILASRSLAAAYASGRNAPQARDDMALAAMLGNAAADLAGLGAVHGLAHALTTKVKLGHGRANAILLPAVMEFNLPAQYHRFSELGRIFGAPAEGLSTIEQAERAVEAVSRLRRDVGLTAKLGAFGLTKADLPDLARTALTHCPAHFASNPRVVTEDDAVAIYAAVL
jgi:alcohol dehydrogenase